MNSRISATLIALLVLGAVMTVNAATKAALNDVTVKLSTDATDTGSTTLKLDVGSKFYLHVNLRDPDKNYSGADVNLQISVDGVAVYDDSESVDFVEGQDYMINLSSDDLSLDSAWDDDLLGYKCSSSTVEVNVSGGIRTKQTATARITFKGDSLEVKRTPSNPTPSDDLTFRVTDSGDDLDGITVRVTNLGSNGQWDSEDDTWDDTTDSNGEVSLVLKDEFNSNTNGLYQVDVWDDGGSYCKDTTTMDVRQSLAISKPDPSSPAVGQSIKMRVTDQSGNGVSGARITISKGSIVTMYTTDSQGYVIFQLAATGAYSMIATKSGYSDSAIGGVTVYEKGSMAVDVTPANPEAGKDIQIQITGPDGNPVKGAVVNVTKPDASSDIINVPDSGKTAYTLVTTGSYKVIVNAPLYSTVTKDIKALSTFQVTAPASVLPLTDIVVQVSDSNGKPVQGASVIVRETGLTAATDSSGKYTFNLTDPKDYTLQVKKDGFQDYQQKITVKGALKIRLDETEASLGKPVSFLVQDSAGNTVSVDVVVSEPTGEKETVSNDTFTPEQAGDYTLTASKDGYAPGTASFTVKPMPLSVTSELKDGKIVVSAASDGKPVADVLVSFTVGSFSDEAKTGTDGKASIAVKNISGNVTITAEAQNYATTGTIQEVKPAAAQNSSTLVIILIALVVIIIVVLILTTRGGKKKTSPLTRSGGSHLGG